MTGGYRLLGRLRDLRQIRTASSGAEMIDLRDSRWNLKLNHSWLENGIRRGDPFLLVSRGDFRGTVLAWELLLLRAAGYRANGPWLIPRDMLRVSHSPSPSAGFLHHRLYLPGLSR